ncbi:MAG TPA: dihydroneopterin aldolase [Candidatus Acidoferrales bacterium]|nr:dihydroneopterin aldolase [Candidatus Acidoferrales bacterium]
MDRIAIRGIRVLGRHGVYERERLAAQPFAVDLVVEIDARSAERSDDMSDTINYADLHQRVVEVVAGTSFALLERLAGEILSAAFEDARIARAEVTIGKPEILGGATPFVTLARENPRHRG